LRALGFARAKENSVHAYNVYCQIHELDWNPPEYKPQEKLPWIPTEEEINSLISRCRRKTRTLLQLLKETGMRIGEACTLKLEDVDFERGVVNITAEKGSRGRAARAM
jgi:integrase